MCIVLDLGLIITITAHKYIIVIITGITFLHRKIISKINQYLLCSYDLSGMISFFWQTLFCSSNHLGEDLLTVGHIVNPNY